MHVAQHGAHGSSNRDDMKDALNKQTQTNARRIKRRMSDRSRVEWCAQWAAHHLRSPSSLSARHLFDLIERQQLQLGRRSRRTGASRHAAQIRLRAGLLHGPREMPGMNLLRQRKRRECGEWMSICGVAAHRAGQSATNGRRECHSARQSRRSEPIPPPSVPMPVSHQRTRRSSMERIDCSVGH